MKDNYTHITFILDNSGSMAPLLNDTIGGFNTFLKAQKEAPGEATFSLNQFAYNENPVKVTHDFLDIKKVPDLDTKNYEPNGGSTPLLDAIGQSIVEVGNKLDKLADADKPSKVLFVILTDGHENSSKTYNRAKILEMIKHQSEVYSWEFIYLGANQDAIAVGAAMGIAPTRSMNFATSAAGQSSTYTTVGAKLASYRSTNDASVLDFTEEERTKSMSN